MSHSCDYAYEVYREARTLARKSHRCDACGETIPAKTTYYRLFACGEGEVESVKRCDRCQAIHVHLREKCRASGGDLWPDERLACGLIYEDEWGELPHEIAVLAFALPGETTRQEPSR